MKHRPNEPKVLVKVLAVRDISWELGLAAIGIALISLLTLV